MLRALWAIITNDPAARAEHFDRNQHQQHQLPQMPDQSDVQCVVDDHLTTWVGDGAGFRLINHLFDLHEPDAQSWRGIPAQAFLDTSEPDQSAPVSDLSGQSQDEHYQSTLQLITTGPDHHTSRLSTYDYVSPRDSVAEHFTRDVLPHMVWGGGYNSYDMTSGEDLSHVDRADVHANVYPCENGQFVGSDNFRGIDDPVSAGGQLSAGFSSHAGSATVDDPAPVSTTSPGTVSLPDSPPFGYVASDASPATPSSIDGPSTWTPANDLGQTMAGVSGHDDFATFATIDMTSGGAAYDYALGAGGDWSDGDYDSGSDGSESSDVGVLSD